MIRGLFSSTSSRLPLEDVLELANEHLDNARNARTPTKALLLCDNAKASLKDAENILNKRVNGQTLNDDIANAYQRHGKLLEELGQHSKAEKSYSKAKKWGYIHVETLQIGPTRPTNPNDFIRRSLSPPTSFSAASTITPAVYLGDSDVNNQTLIHQGHKDDAHLAKSEDQMPVTSKDTGQVQQMIFGRDATPSMAKFILPRPGGRITSTSQLAYCLSLLRHSLDSKEGLDKDESDWLQAMDDDPVEKGRLQTMATDVIRAFVRDELKRSDAVAEIIGLSAVLEQDDFRKLLEVFVDGVEQSVLLKVHLLDGMSYLMKNVPQGSLDPDDLVKILELLSTRLKGTHQQSTQHSYLLAMTVSRVLDSMVDSQVEGLAREQLHEPLSQYLQDLQKSSDPRLVYQAAYAYQSLQYIPDDETILQAMMRRTGKVVQGISGVVSAVKALDVNGFINGLRHIEEGLAGASKAIVMVNDAYRNAKTLTESGQGFLEYLKEGLSLSHKSAWYPALRGLDLLIQEGRFTEFEKLIRDAPCRQDPAFQWGVCQRLGEIASSVAWDTETRQYAIAFLGEMYKDDSQWGQQIPVKQWIFHILSTLANSYEGDVASTAKKQFQDLEAVGDSNKDSLHRSYDDDSKESHTSILALPSLQGSRLLDIVQNKADVETPLRQLKHDRLREGGRDVYISPRAKHHANATDSFDLTSKVQEFLSSQKKVFLLLGDSGSGKSTFNRSLEMDLWKKYGKDDERIPLFIHLPTIKQPQQGLIDKHLRDLNFTENQIRELKLHREFILICDGYDESQQTRNLYMSNRLNQLGQWRAQMMIGCRTEYIGADYKSCFQPTDRNNSGGLELFQEAIIAPFNKDQVQDYIDQYVTLRDPPWRSIDYQQALQQIPNLQDLVTNPFLLKLALEVLPRLLDTDSIYSTARITRVELYEEFVSQWIERSHIRLRDMDLNPRDQEAFKMLSNSGFKQECISYLKELATSIYDNQGGNPIVEYSERRDQKTWKRTLFNNLDGKNLLREATPLICNNGRYKFMHKSLLEYGLSLAVFDPNEYNGSKEPTPSNTSRRGSISSVMSFEDSTIVENSAAAIEQPLLDSPLGRKSFVDDPSVSLFLVERSWQEPVFAQQLHAVIERSKTDKAARVAAANAITVLVRAGVEFVGADLRGIRIPGADLSYGMFDSAQLDGADLRKANLCNIWLRNVTLNGAQMAGVQFGELPLIQEIQLVTCCAYSRDGKILAVGLIIGELALYDTSSWRLLRVLRGHTKDIRCLIYSEASDQIISGTEGGEARQWNVETGDCVHTLNCDGNVLAITANSSSNGYQAASGCQDYTIHLWDFETGNCVQILQGHQGTICEVTYSPKGDRLASASEDETLRIWDIQSGDCFHILRGHSHVVCSVAYSPDGSQIASGSLDKTMKLWEVETGNCVDTLVDHSGPVTSIVYSSNGDEIATGSHDQSVRLWNVKAGSSFHAFHGHGMSVSSVVYSPNGGQIASGSWDQTVRLWNIETGKFSHTLEGHTSFVPCVTHSPKGDQVASSSWDGTVRLWDAETGNCSRILEEQNFPIYSVAYSPKGDLIATGASDETVRLWDVETGDCVLVLRDHGSRVDTVAFSPDGNRIACGCGKIVVLWDVKTRDCLHTLLGHEDTIPKVAYSPNGATIASGSQDNSVKLWDVETGSNIHTLQGHTETVLCVAYSPKGYQLASSSTDRTVRLWDVESGDAIHLLRGHTYPVLAVVYSPNGKYLATGSFDKTVQVWDINTQQCLIISGFSGGVTSIAFDPLNCQYLVTGCGDKSVRRWKIIKEQEEYQAHLCWSSSNDGLVVADATFDDVQGLSQMNWTLLLQRGALRTSTPANLK